MSSLKSNSKNISGTSTQKIFCNYTGTTILFFSGDCGERYLIWFMSGVCLVYDIKWRVSDVWLVVFVVWWRMSDVCYVMVVDKVSGERCVLFWWLPGERYLCIMFDESCLASVWSMMSDVYLVYDVWCLVSGWCIIYAVKSAWWKVCVCQKQQ